MVILSAFGTPSLVSAEDVKRVLSQSTSSYGTLAVIAKPCQIDNEIVVVGHAETKVFSELRSKWNTVIKEFKVFAGESVKKNDPIALVDTSQYGRQREIFDNYLQLYTNYAESINREYQSVKLRRANVAKLVEKAIVAESELQKIDAQIAKINENLQQIKQTLITTKKTIKDIAEQERMSNFVSPINGVVTKLVVDPRSVTGNVVTSFNSIIARIEAPGTYLATALVLDVQVAKIKKGMTAEVVLMDGSKYLGKVIFSSPFASASKVKADPNANDYGYQIETSAPSDEKERNKFQVVVEFSKPGQILPDATLVKIILSPPKAEAAQCLPWNAIDIKNKGTFVNVLEVNKGWVEKKAKLGRRGRHYVEILSPDLEGSMVSSRLW